ncbi:SEP-domain-containing protein [Gymnopus androsaceus JB14]|uniref:SEP-domain-containing protein n=1 Tax=Gymnopus androsaceus JB14 TaxID=1447944 RepID=A0A6A4HLI5_9AGAR|nr:SEP-domain-containing protein [Gymnopus androsaceus JB14]
MVRDLLRRAAEGGPPPTAEAVSRTFTGGGHRLGSDEVESSYIPDPSAPEGEGEPTVRHLTFWRDGFTVEDGELMRYDDPNNASILEEIHAGRAPPSLLNVRAGDPVELRVARRTDEDYTPPKHAAFTGTGHRLGAGGSSSSGLPMPGSFAEAPQASASSSSREESRLADGTRIVCRMNLTHTVLDLRNFINASRPENLTRPYSIGTTFPNRTLDDLNATIEGAGLKNSVVVQKWE